LVFNAGGGTLDGLSVTVLYGPYGTDWLTTSLSSTTAPATLTLTAQGYVSIASPPYTATVTISSNVPGAGTKTITVTYSPL
jgi:hypothetical protein